MFRAKFNKSAIISTAIIAVLFGAFLSTPTQARSVLNVAPDNSIACLRIQNLDTTFAELDKFLLGISPIPVSTSALTRMQIGSVLGNPNLDGVNTAGEYGIIVSTSDGKTVDIENLSNLTVTLLLPITNYKVLLENSKAVKDADADGISTIVPLNGLAKGETLSMANVDDYAAIAFVGSPETLMNFKVSKSNPLGAALNPHEKEMAATHSFFFTVKIGELSKLNKEFSANMLAELEQASKDSPEIATYKTLIETVVKVSESLLSEIERESICLEFKPDLCLVTANVSAVVDSNLAKVFSPNKLETKANPLLGYLESNQATTCAGKIQKDSLKYLIDDLKKIITDSNPSIDTKIADKFVEYIDLLGKYFVFSEGPAKKEGRSFTSTEVCQINDPLAYDKYIRSMSEKIIDFTNSLVSSAGVKYALNISQADEDGIATANMSINVVDPNNPAATVAKSMYGNTFETCWGYAGNLVATGSDKDTVRKLLAKIKTRSAKKEPADIAKAFDLIPDIRESDIFGTYNYINSMKMSANLMPDEKTKELFNKAFSNIETKSYFVYSLNLADRNLTTTLALPKEHIQEIMQGFMTLSMMGQMQPPAPSTPSEERLLSPPGKK